MKEEKDGVDLHSRLNNEYDSRAKGENVKHVKARADAASAALAHSASD